MVRMWIIGLLSCIVLSSCTYADTIKCSNGVGNYNNVYILKISEGVIYFDDLNDHHRHAVSIVNCIVSY